LSIHHYLLISAEQSYKSKTKLEHLFTIMIFSIIRNFSLHYCHEIIAGFLLNNLELSFSCISIPSGKGEGKQNRITTKSEISVSYM